MSTVWQILQLNWAQLLALGVLLFFFVKKETALSRAREHSAFVLTCAKAVMIAAFALVGTGVPGDWRRSRPLSPIYLPTKSSKNDRCNKQVVGIVSKSGY